jgi:hypothetical protein
MLTVPDHRAGTDVRCWQCKRVVTAPELVSSASLLYAASAELPSLPPTEANKYPPQAFLPGAKPPGTTYKPGAIAIPTPPAPPTLAMSAAPPLVAPPVLATKKRAPVEIQPAPVVSPTAPVSVQINSWPPTSAAKSAAPEKPAALSNGNPSTVAILARRASEGAPPNIQPAAAQRVLLKQETPGGNISNAAMHRPARPSLGYRAPLSSRLAEARRRDAARWLALGLLACAIVGAAPAVLLLVRAAPNQAGSQLGSAVGLWVSLSLVAALIQAAYSAYVWQLFDCGATMAVAFISLAYTAAYASLTAAFLLTEDGAALSWLGIPIEFAGKAAPWSFLMLCLSGSLAYAAGQLSLRRRVGRASPRVAAS